MPDVGQCELSFVYVGESNYRRQYRIFSTNSDSVYKQDFSSEVFFRSEPDAGGNMCSPIATVFQSASFISALEELALQAEVVRARQLLVTQPSTRTRARRTSTRPTSSSTRRAAPCRPPPPPRTTPRRRGSLALQAQMMQMINRLQTTNADPNRAGRRLGRARARAAAHAAAALRVPGKPRLNHYT